MDCFQRRRGAPSSQPSSLSEPLEGRLLFAAVVSTAVTDVYFEMDAPVAAFRNSLRGPTWHGNNNGGLASARGYREVNWDVPGAELVGLPGDYYHTAEVGGLLLSTPGTALLAGRVWFQAVNPTYPLSFQSLTRPRNFSPQGSTVTDATFRVPYTDLPATVSAFGMVFTDVDGADTTTIEFFDPAGASLGVFAAPPRDKGLSFLGVRFDAGEQIARARVTSGNTPLGPDDGGAAADVVVMDDLIFAEPQPNVPNLYRFDGGGDGKAWSNPANWHPDVVPPPGAALEIPNTSPTLDLPAGATVDSLLFSSIQGGIRFTESGRRLGLRNGIRSLGQTFISGLSIGGGRLVSNVALDLLGSQTFSTESPISVGSLSVDGEVNLNGHDLTLAGPGMMRFDTVSKIWSPSGGRLIKNGQGWTIIQIPSGNDVDFPREVTMNEGRLWLSSDESPAIDLSETSVRVNGGLMELYSTSIGPVDVVGGALSPAGLSVEGDLSFSSAATFDVTLYRNGDASSYITSVAGAVNLRGAAMNVNLNTNPPYAAMPGDRHFLIRNDGTDPVNGTFRNIPEGGPAWFEGRLFRVTYRGGDGNDVVMRVLAPAAYEFDSPRQPVRVSFAPGTEPAGVASEDLRLENLTTGQTVPASSMESTYDPSTGTATWTFPGFSGGALPDGNYRATVDPAGPAGPVSFDFFALAGDVNRDRSVNGTDFGILAANFGKSAQEYESGDLNSDGVVNGSDFALLARNFGRSVPAPPAPAAVAAAPTIKAPTGGTQASTTPRRRTVPKKVQVPAPRRAIAPARRQIRPL